MVRNKPDDRIGRLFRHPSGQDELFDKSYEEELDARRGEPVECLGLTFENKVEVGFPHGEIEDILNLSDPPWHTARPNPFLSAFVEACGKPRDPGEPYRRKPSAVDVSEGKTHPVYRAHGYHAKVPYLVIVPSILHYTEPGNLVLDDFAGTGMTGVAAQWCGTAPESYRKALEAQWAKEGFGSMEGYAAEWTVDQLHEPAQRITLQTDELMNAVARSPVNSGGAGAVG